MHFGLGQFTLQKPPFEERDHAQLLADMLDLAALADRSGFDSVWLAEHHGAADGYNPSLLPVLAAIAARTGRVAVGTAVLLAPFHDPLRIAEDAAVVQNISRGRLRLGLGLGWAAEEYRMFGVDPASRGRRLEEFVEVLRRAWSPGRFSFDGSIYSYEDVAVTPDPCVPIPLWLGGNVEAALRRAARVADGHFPPSTQGVAHLVPRAQEMLALRAELGVEGPYGFGSFVPVGIGEDPEDAWRSIREGVMHVRGSYMLWAQNQRDVSGAVQAVEPFEEQIRAGCVVGTPEQVVAQLAPVVEALDAMPLAEAFISAQLAVPGMPVERARRAIEVYASEVIPALR